MGNAPCLVKDKDDGQLKDMQSKTLQLESEVASLKSQLAALGWNARDFSGSSLGGTTAGKVSDPSVQWLNTIILELWPKISGFITTTVKTTVEPLIQGALPAALSGGFYFDTVTLGDEPLKFGSITATPEDYVGRNGKVRDVALKFNTIYRGDAKVVFAAAGAKIGIESIQLEGTLTIVLKELLEKPPFVSGVSVFFANSPSIRMSWNGAASVLGLPGLKHTIMDVIRQQVNNICVLPKRIAVILDKSEPRLFRIKSPRPPGCLFLTIKAARNLQGKDWNLFGKATSDPYVSVRVGAQTYKTKIVKKTTDPTFDEDFSFYVFDKSQHLCLDLYDEDFATGDDFLGRFEMPVAKIVRKCTAGLTWIPLEPEETDDGDVLGGHGEIQVEAKWMPMSIDQPKAKAITKSSPKPQALLFLGLYSLKVPPAAVGTSYTIEVSCPGAKYNQTTTLTKASAEEAEDTEIDKENAEFKDKIAKLRELKATDEDIATILSIPEAALKEKDPAASKYTDRVMVEEPFLWLIDIPKEASVDIEITQVSILKVVTKLCKVSVKTSLILEESNCTKRETIKSDDGKIEVDVLSQVRVITPS